MSPKYYGNRRIVSETDDYVVGDRGETVRRRVTTLEDGTRLVSDTPLQGAHLHTHPSAPVATSDLSGANEIPVVRAVDASQMEPVNVSSHLEPVAVVAADNVVAAPPPSGSVAIVTGAPQPPVYSHQPTRYRDNSGALTCMGISCIVGIVVLICCVLPAIIVIVVWVSSAKHIDDWIDQDVFEDDFFKNNDF